MTELKEHQFEILPSTEASEGFVFGIGAEVSVNGEGGFDPGEKDALIQDGQNTRRGIRSFGRDVPGAATWLWESHTDREDVKGAVDTLERFSAAWQPYEAQNPGWVTAVRYRLAGRTRRVFGRPRRFAAPPTNLILDGMVPVTHDFACVDSYTYDDAPSGAVIPFSSGAVGGGFSFPSNFPVATKLSDGNGAQQINVGGNARAYPVIRLYGPWTNPSIGTSDWEIRWTGSIPASGWLEIDARPWMLTVLDQGGASQAGGLDRRTWLEDVWFAPKTQPMLNLGGYAPGGAAQASVTWRNTWTSI